MKINYKAYAVASAVVHPAGGYINRLAGTFIGGTSTATWIQIHDAKAVPNNGAVPLRSWGVTDESPYQQTWNETELTFLNGCVIVFSTTEEKLTASAETGDIFVEGESPYDNSAVTMVGDLTTGDDELQVWATAAGPHTLKRLEITLLSNPGSDSYVFLFAKDSPSNGDVSPFPVFAIAQASADLRFDEAYFLSQGTGVVSGSIQTNDGTLYKGMTVVISSTQATLTKRTGNTSFAIQASYVN